jgi:hypothetical protein
MRFSHLRICISEICTSVATLPTKKALSLKQDGFNILVKSYYIVLPAIASLTESLGTIWVLNE